MLFTKALPFVFLSTVTCLPGAPNNIQRAPAITAADPTYVLPSLKNITTSVASLVNVISHYQAPASNQPLFAAVDNTKSAIKTFLDKLKQEKKPFSRPLTTQVGNALNFSPTGLSGQLASLRDALATQKAAIEVDGSIWNQLFGDLQGLGNDLTQTVQQVISFVSTTPLQGILTLYVQFIASALQTAINALSGGAGPEPEP